MPARVGQTLLEAAAMHKIDITHPCDGPGGPTQVIRTKDWTEDTFGEGFCCYFCHVKIPSSFHHLLPPMFEVDKKRMEDVWDSDFSKTSRLACSITLGKQHEGLVVLVPNAPVTDVCM